MESMTTPRSPIIIAGDEYRNWRYAGPATLRNAQVEVTIPEDAKGLFLVWLGQYRPGLLEDGSPTDWYIFQINGNRVLLIPSVRAAWRDLL